MGLQVGVVSLIVLMGSGVFSNVDATLTLGDESIHEGLISSAPREGKQDWNIPESPGWEKRFFGQPQSQYDFQKKKFRPKRGLGLSLKSPGKLPGIEFGLEMHSLGALQSVVPAERLPRALNFQQEQPLMLSPSNISPDYNGGFLRFTW